MDKSTIRVATDVGGTFTDLVCFETNSETGDVKIVTAKSDTTPPNFEEGVLNVLKKGNVDPAGIDFMAHGTTVVINALTERKGVKVGLITTKGFRDTLELARGNRPDFFNLHYGKPKPFVERRLRQEIPGRMTYQGEEMVPLDLSALPSILDLFRKEGVEAVAISFLHSYANPSHEQATMAEVKKLWPEVAVVSSHQITREWREYERTNTAVLSAYVQPAAERYLSHLKDGLIKQDFDGSIYIMQSNCGVDTIESVSAIPITMVESGPASGFWGAAELGRLIGEKDVLALDIGGTTAKCALIEGGEVRIMTDYWIERDKSSAGYPIMVPVVDLVEIGNGGGSIAWVDDFGKLHVGPQSAGAMPGPAAYGRGGVEATTTDANLWLGRINKDYFCGGSLDADMGAVETALAKVGDKLGVDKDEAARGIIRIANNNMVNALKLVSLNRGHDPRDFTLVAFGGGGAMHAVALGKELGVKKVVIPAGASVFSAWGMMMSDLRRDYFVTHLVDLAKNAANEIEQLFTQSEAVALKQFATEDIAADRVKFLRYGKFRYQNQEHTTEVLIEGAITDASIAQITENFHAAYEHEYTYRLDAPVELVGIHLVAAAEVGKLEMVEKPVTGTPASEAVKSERKVDYATQGIFDAKIYDGDKLEPGMSFVGPAIIEDSGTTVVVDPECKVEVDGYSNIHIHLQA
ncbi:hydantoinase/oxoprolinase family protein [uncultured Cohaesibacter sp.]|uniref:hydantoinase/oxoprolinase family protein n=1 Tax=uncultured Cohaesibacter sp. TaxID=1002546 RepID=UPI002930CA88|nr:hydantoinase/oxoprolinase family protein [uncultured Cohaesibacter sp.]